MLQGTRELWGLYCYRGIRINRNECWAFTPGCCIGLSTTIQSQNWSVWQLDGPCRSSDLICMDARSLRLVTDHVALKWMFSLKDPNPRLNRLGRLPAGFRL